MGMAETAAPTHWAGAAVVGEKSDGGVLRSGGHGRGLCDGGTA